MAAPPNAWHQGYWNVQDHAVHRQEERHYEADGQEEQQQEIHRYEEEKDHGNFFKPDKQEHYSKIRHVVRNLKNARADQLTPNQIHALNVQLNNLRHEEIVSRLRVEYNGDTLFANKYGYLNMWDDINIPEKIELARAQVDPDDPITMEDVYKDPNFIDSYDRLQAHEDEIVEDMVKTMNVAHVMRDINEKLHSFKYALKTEIFHIDEFFEDMPETDMVHRICNLLRVLREHVKTMHVGMSRVETAPDMTLLFRMMDSMDLHTVSGVTSVNNVFKMTVFAKDYSMQMHVNFQADSPAVEVPVKGNRGKFLKKLLTSVIRMENVNKGVSLYFNIFTRSGDDFLLQEQHHVGLIQDMRDHHQCHFFRIAAPEFDDSGLIFNIRTDLNAKVKKMTNLLIPMPYDENAMMSLLVQALDEARMDDVYNDKFPEIISNHRNGKVQYVFYSHFNYAYYLAYLDMREGFEKTGKDAYDLLPVQVAFAYVGYPNLYTDTERNTSKWVFQTKIARQAKPPEIDSPFYSVEYVNPGNFGTGLYVSLARKGVRVQKGSMYKFYVNHLDVDEHDLVYWNVFYQKDWDKLDEIRVRCQTFVSTYLHMRYNAPLFLDFRRMQKQTGQGWRMHPFREYLYLFQPAEDPIYPKMMRAMLKMAGYEVDTWHTYKESEKQAERNRQAMERAKQKADKKPTDKPNSNRPNSNRPNSNRKPTQRPNFNRRPTQMPKFNRNQNKKKK